MVGGISLLAPGAALLRLAEGASEGWSRRGFVVGGVAVLAVALVLIAAGVSSRRRSIEPQTPRPFDSKVFTLGSRVILTLQAVPPGARRPDLWNVTVRRLADDWRAYIDHTTALVREGGSPPGALEVVFPDDFVGCGDAPAAGWYEVTWFRTTLGSSGEPCRTIIARERFQYEGGGELLRYATDPRRSA